MNRMIVTILYDEVEVMDTYDPHRKGEIDPWMEASYAVEEAIGRTLGASAEITIEWEH